jgi:hypothetical protein
MIKGMIQNMMFDVGYVGWIFLRSIMVPILILAVCRFIPATKRRPKSVYGICGAIAVFTAGAMLLSGTDLIPTLQAAVLAGGLFFWGYNRANKKTLLPDSA